MRLSQSYGLDRGFDRLIQVDSGYFFCLLFMMLSRFNDSSHEFDRLI